MKRLSRWVNKMYVFIINPIAGNGRAKKAYNKIKTSALYSQIKKEIYITEYKGHGKEIIEKIRSRDLRAIKSIIVIGGDDTIHEVANGLSQFPVNLAFIPGGSGNDFARGCKIKENPVTLFENIVKGKGKIKYWLGKSRVDGEVKRFVNNLGIGFDAEVADKANKARYKGFLSKLGLGNISYLFALIQMLFLFKPKNIKISYDGKERLIKNCWMITVSNHPYFGGGMKIIPNAKIQPDAFPILIIHSISKWKVLALFLTVFTGKHLKYKEVELFETKAIHILAENKIYYHADGESSMCTQLTVKKQEVHLNILGSGYSTD